MIGGPGQQVLDLVQRWTPQKEYDHERKFQQELQEYLDRELNSSGFMGGGGNHVVSTERGTSYGDVVVDDQVGIELKRNFSNDQKKKLRGQLEDYADSYDLVIACACGIDDMDGWREIENKFSGGRGMDMTRFEFVVKRREDFGTGHEGGDQGLLGGDPFGGDDDTGGLL